MEIINSILFGLVQGVAEFFPVSSSGHLVILHQYISLPIKDDVAFDVILHLATLLAVVIYFRKDISTLFSSWIRSFFGSLDENSRLSWFIILATIPAALAGFFLEDWIETFFRSDTTVAFMLVAIGIVMIVFERICRKADNLTDLNWKKTLLIGVSQALSLIPGTSRSGITIIAGLWTGLNRESAVRFSFLLSIPLIAGAGIKKAPIIFGASLNANEVFLLAVSFFTALFSGIWAIKYFLKLSKKIKLNIFAYYRFFLALIIIFLLIIKN